MKIFLKKVTQCRGTTLVEILVALAITGVVTMAMMKLYVAQHENYLLQDDVTTTQQNARASIDELSRHIRMAGNELPAVLPALSASDCNPDTITINYMTSGCESALASPMPLPSSELKCKGDISCFVDGQWAFIYEPDSGGGEWFEISHVQADALHIQHNTMSLSKVYGADAVLLGVTQVKFFVDNTTDPSSPNLMVQYIGQSPQVYAEKIVDLQFRYRLANNAIVDAPASVSDVREVIMEIVAEGDRENPFAVGDQDMDNPEKLHSRSFTSSVNVRNI